MPVTIVSTSLPKPTCSIDSRINSGSTITFFQPVMRLHEKHFENGPVKRRYDSAQTPLDRLCRTQKLTPLKQAQLQALRHTLNPLQLRKNIQDLIDKIFALPCAAAQGNAEDVYLTLLP